MLAFDQKFFLLIHGLTGKIRFLDSLGVFLADYFGYFLLAAAVYFIWREGHDWKKRFRAFSFLALAIILSRGIFTELIRFFYYRPRPFMALDFAPLGEAVNKGAFPSGHAAFYFALAGTLLLFNRRAGVYFGIGAAAIGLARIFTGLHWPLDILGGLGTAILAVYLVKLSMSYKSLTESI